MPNPPDLAQRMADIIDRPLVTYRIDGDDSAYMTSYCAKAIAEELISELGLTVEWALARGGGHQTVMPERAVKAAVARHPESSTAVTRYVTKWVDQ